jgi:bla regulator protein blaR1
MINEPLRDLFTLTIVSSSAIIILLLLRRYLRQAFGPAVSYFAWLLVPAVIVAALLPNTRASGLPFAFSMQVPTVSALGVAYGSAAVPSIDGPVWLLGAWGVGSALFLLYLAGLQYTFLRRLGALSHSRGMLRAASSAGCPALVGIFRPKVILPVDFEARYTLEEQSLILAHESTHLRHQDALWNALVALIRSLFWFNPLVHLGASRFRVDQELACDAAVIRSYPNSRRAYAAAMLKTQLADSSLPVGCHWHSGHPLKERIEMLKKSPPSSLRRHFGRVLVALASVLGGCLAWAAEPTAAPTVASTSAVMQMLLHAAGSESTSMDAASANQFANGNAVFKEAVFSYGPDTDRAAIKADRVRVTRQEDPRTPALPTWAWTFAGNVVISRGGQSFSVAGLKFESQGKGRKFAILGSRVSISPSGP